MAILAAFEEEELSRFYAAVAVGGRVFETGVVGNSRTVQQRTVNRYDYANVWEIQYGGLSTAEKKPLEEFFTMKWGRAIGFRFFPPSDRDFENDVIGIGDGSTTTFYMRRNYRSRTRFYSRRIVKPVRHTVIVLQDGQKVPYDDPADGIFYPGISGDYPEFYNPITVDWNAGIIGFPTPPTAGQIIRCVDGQYDIPVFFETDVYQSADDIFTEWNSVRVVEIPPAQITSTGLALTPLSLAFTAPPADAYKPVSFDVTLSHTGVAKVYLYVDDVLVATDAAAPFSFSMVASPTTGPFRVTALGVDNTGHFVEAAITLNTEQPPGDDGTESGGWIG
jgi:uncharacterized protein (TIGR02217 family)